MKARHCASLVLAAVAGCTSTDPLSGGSSDHGNAAVACFARHEDGSPAVDATVRVRAADYLADTNGGMAPAGYDTRTDSLGYFFVASVDPGNYVIEINDDSAAAVILAYTTDGTDGPTVLPPATLEPHASVRGTVLLPETDGTASAHVLVQGIERSVRIDGSDSAFVFTDLPPALYSLHVLSPRERYLPKTVTSVTAVAGDTNEVGRVVLNPYGTWSYSRRLRLNTGSSGLDLAEELYDFPLLVRLDAATFNFLRARADGADLRVAQSDGLPLRFAIDHWNPAGQQAALWVRVDTLRPGLADQHLLLYAGNAAATAVHDQAAVFDTALGYGGVWLMQDGLRESTSRGVTATDHGTTAAAGLIGNARSFSKPDSTWAELAAPEMGITAAAGAATLWLRTSHDYASAEGIVFYATQDKGEGYGRDSEWHVSINAANQLEVFMRDSLVDQVTVTAPSVCNDGVWHHVVASWDTAGEVRLYI
ncbi:MAG: DUF2341 domain-containing protein, partial [Chitinivibrionales bacterium]|nr:DUF2341 domain-containing protein [Chitinivibrionales bacterium]